MKSKMAPRPKAKSSHMAKIVLLPLKPNSLFVLIEATNLRSKKKLSLLRKWLGGLHQVRMTPA